VPLYQSIDDVNVDPAVLSLPESAKIDGCIKAAIAGDLSQLIFFEAHGANIHYNNEYLLKAAAHSGNKEVVEYLVLKNADIHASDDEALRLASITRNTIIADYLLECGANIHAHGDESLSNAFKNRDYDTIRVLLKHGARIKAVEQALENVVLDHDVEVVKILLESGESGKCFHPYRTRLARSSPVFNFLKICEPLLAFKDDPKESAAYLGIRDRKSLKSDAYHRETETSLPYFTRCALHALSVAVAVGRWPHEGTVGLMSLIRNDIDRVESTTGLSWKRYHESLSPFTSHARDAKDLVEEVTSVLVLPELVIARGKADLTSEIVERLYKESIFVTRKLLLEDKTTADFLRLNRLWHRGGNRAPIELRPFLQYGEWVPLFYQMTLSNGISVQCLTTAAELVDEGNRLHHCVGGYASACQRGHSHILSFRKGDISIATLELSEGRGHGPSLADGRLRNVQFRGDNNTRPITAASEAWEELRQMINRKEIALSEEVGLTKRAKEYHATGLTPLEKLTGFSLREFSALRPQFLEHYRNRVTIERRGMNISLIDEAQLFSTIHDYALNIE